MNNLVIKQQVTQWVKHVVTKLNDQLVSLDFEKSLNVATKSSRNDLVTNFDRQVERYYVSQIRKYYPQAKIVGEEGFGDQVDSLSGLVFFVDPIDGTMNFVRQHQNFATMIGVYENGKPVFGIIADVRQQLFMTGGTNLPLELNGKAWTTPLISDVSAGLIGLNAYFLMEDRYHIQSLVKASSGARITGSAGIEFLSVLLGQQVGYVSALASWDLAAGYAIAASEHTINIKTVAAQTPGLLNKEVVVIGQSCLLKAFMDLQKS